MTNNKLNSAKGVHSYDSNIGNTVVSFINRNVSEYATESGGPKFDLVPVEKHKDIMLNVARLHAKQEYDRIMELVSVLQKQADQIKHRLDLTDMVHAAKYDFRLSNGNVYWLLFDHRKQITRLSINGPSDWSTGKPEEYEYICQMKWLGDHTWIEV
jgi:hypothetical protein